MRRPPVVYSDMESARPNVVLFHPYPGATCDTEQSTQTQCPRVAAACRPQTEFADIQNNTTSSPSSHINHHHQLTKGCTSSRDSTTAKTLTCQPTDTVMCAHSSKAVKRCSDTVSRNHNISHQRKRQRLPAPSHGARRHK